jgi:lipoprotein-releasing system ATP-binding protein
MGIARKEKILEATNIWKEYRSGQSDALHVLKGLDLEIRNGELVAIVGPSGSGKSTLLHILGGLDKPTEGRIVVEGDDLLKMSEERLSRFRNESLGFVFQFHHLLPEFSALENVCMPALIQGRKLKEVSERGSGLLREVGLEARIQHKPSELSGGEQQRVAVARALMNNPKIILADEPSGNLDEENGHILHKLLVQLCVDKDLTFVIATHNPDLTKRAHRVLKLSDGKLTPTKH